ncbi:MAG: XRE family transcriptional regulator [bacterium]
MEEFGKTLRQYRKHRRMTQTELASAVGVAPAYVSQIESSLRVPSLRVARKIAEVLHVELPALLGPPGERVTGDHLSDVEKLESLRTLVRSVEHDLESRPEAESVEQYPGAAGVRLVTTPDHVVRAYSFTTASTPAVLQAHPGEEIVYCASGRVRVLIDDEEHVLHAGGLLRFDAGRMHIVIGEPGSTAVSTAAPPPAVESLQRLAVHGADDAAWLPGVSRSAEAG